MMPSEPTSAMKQFLADLADLWRDIKITLKIGQS